MSTATIAPENTEKTTRRWWRPLYWCEHCRRFQRQGEHDVCPKRPPAKPVKKFWKPRPMTAADLIIARKFAKCRSMEMF